MKTNYRILVSALVLAAANQAAAEVLFQEDFESEVASAPQPVWSWQAPFGPENTNGMMLGEGDIYERSQAESAQGAYSLRLNFDGRNGFCNTCGNDTVFVAQGINGETSFKPTDTSVLSLLPDERRPIFNKDDNWARWTASRVEGGTVYLQNDAPVRNEMSGSALFSAGQEIKIARACGVDGDVAGNNVNRRSDCNLAINLLQGISAEHFPYGGTIARRMYLYIPRATVLPSTTLKLGYSIFTEANQVYPLVSVGRDESFELQTSGLVGSHTFTGQRFERDTWYYLEEIYTRESSSIAKDGRYTVYFSKVGEHSATPTVHFVDLRYGELKDMSIIGNWQHTNDASGFVYIDDVAVATSPLGPVGHEDLLSINVPSMPALR